LDSHGFLKNVEKDWFRIVTWLMAWWRNADDVGQVRIPITSPGSFEDSIDHSDFQGWVTLFVFSAGLRGCYRDYFLVTPFYSILVSKLLNTETKSLF
jgi:hypothetical protein